MLNNQEPWVKTTTELSVMVLNIFHGMGILKGQLTDNYSFASSSEASSLVDGSCNTTPKWM
jgi:hypothetical protein